MLATFGIACQAVLAIHQIKNQQLMIVNLYLYVIILISPLPCVQADNTVIK